MLNSSGIKINTTILIFLAFIFRLLFSNISLASSSGNLPATKFAVSHFSKMHKKRSQPIESSVKESPEQYTSVEVFEESSDTKEELIKANSPAVSFISYLFLKRIIITPKLNYSFDLIKCDIYPKKYLSLSILRI